MQNLLEENLLTEQLAPVAVAESAKVMNPTMGFMKRLASPEVTAGVTTGVLVSAGSTVGKSAFRKFLTQPLVLFGLGVGVGAGVGYLIYKNRKALNSATDELQQES